MGLGPLHPRRIPELRHHRAFLFRCTLADSELFLKNITLWYACPWTLAVAAVQAGGLGMVRSAWRAYSHRA
jgi:hypothetical protein